MKQGDCTCSVCNDGYILKNNACVACDTVPHCSGYSTSGSLGCVCIKCEDGYTISYGSTSSLNKCVSDTDKVTCSSGGKTWYCSLNGQIMAPTAGQDSGITCGTSVGTCCFNGNCCSENEHPLYNGTVEDYSCCPLSVTSMAWNLNGSSKRCCDVGNTETTVKGPTSGWDYCCPAGSTAIQDGECVEKCTNVEHCATYNTFCACQTCESGFTLNTSTGLCEDARCGTTPSTCTADCPTSCTVPDTIEMAKLIGHTSEWSGFTCENGSCWC